MGVVLHGPVAPLASGLLPGPAQASNEAVDGLQRKRQYIPKRPRVGTHPGRGTEENESLASLIKNYPFYRYRL